MGSAWVRLGSPGRLHLVDCSSHNSAAPSILPAAGDLSLLGRYAGYTSTMGRGYSLASVELAVVAGTLGY